MIQNEREIHYNLTNGKYFLTRIKTKIFSKRKKTSLTRNATFQASPILSRLYKWLIQSGILRIVILYATLYTVHAMMLPVTIVLQVTIFGYELLLQKKNYLSLLDFGSFIACVTKKSYLVLTCKSRTVSKSLRFSSSSTTMSSCAFFRYDFNTSLSCRAFDLKISKEINYNPPLQYSHLSPQLLTYLLRSIVLSKLIASSSCRCQF